MTTILHECVKKLQIIYITTKYIANDQANKLWKTATWYLKSPSYFVANRINQLNMFVFLKKTLCDAYFVTRVRKMTQII